MHRNGADCSVKVGVCLPTGDDVKTDFALSLALAKWSPHQVALINRRAALVPLSRYKLVQDAISCGCEAVFFIDSDTGFPPDSLERLVAHNRPIVGASCASRREPHEFVGEFLKSDVVWSEATGLHRMKQMGVCFCLIRIRVFSDVPRPWFPIKFLPEISEFRGEDLCFCDDARNAGYDIWCDMDLSRELSHVGTKAHWLDHSSDMRLSSSL